MLKFVSTKPPRGKHEIHPDFHRQARGHFRLKAQSDTQTGLHTFDGENSLSFDSDGREKNEHNRSLLMTTNDEYDNLPHDKKFPMHTSSVSSALQSNLDTHVSRSRTPSASSQDSSRSLLRHHDMYAGKRSGTFRHVTWSPEVINGVQSNHPLAEQNLNKPTSNASEKKQTFAKAGKKSLQGISRFLLGDPARRHKRSRSTDIEMDNLHKGSVEDSHSLISDYLQSSQSKSADDHVTSIPSNQNEDTRSQFLKSHEETSHEKSQKPKPHSPWSLHKVIHHFQTKIDQGKSNQSTVKAESHDISKDDKDYYDNSTDISQNSKVIVDHQSKPPTHHLPKDFKRNGDFVFAPISFSTPKKKDLFVLDDSNEKNRKTKEKRDSGDVISVGTTWDQRPFSSDYEEIKVANENSLPHLKANQITKSSSNLQSDWMIGNQAIEIPSKKRQKRNYPRLNLTSFRDVPSQFDIVRPVSAPKSLSGQHHTEKLYSKIQKSPERKLEQREVLNDAIQSNMTSQKVSKHVEDTHRRKNLSPQPVGIHGNVMTSCVPQINHDMNKNESVRRYHVTREIPMSTSQSQHSVMNSSLHDMINRSHDHKMESDQVELDLVYITERIISMSFPSDEHEATYQYNLKGVMNMLRGKHGENILILNFSEPRNDLQKENNQRVIDYGWPDHLAPPLERLCNICKSIDSWLNSDPSHVIVLHSKGGRGRLAVVIAAFMHYSSICASADQAMDRMAMKRFYDDKLGGVMYPSHKRYVQYFSGLLSGSIKINSQALYLHHLVIHGVPNFDAHGGCRPFIKVYQGMQPIFTSGVYNVTDQMQKVCISISPGIPLRGDIMIKCYHKKSQSGQREPIWRCQFHTCAISHYNLLFGKKELDDALYDPRFPDIGKVEFVFGPNQDANVQVSDFKSDVTVPVDDNTDGLVRWDSYESFSHIDGVPTHNERKLNGIPSTGGSTSKQEAGPVDGSLYATVNKRKHENFTETTVIRNGTQFNGSYSPHASSDSGISGTSGILGNTTTSPSSMSPPYSSYNTETRQYNSSQHGSNYSTASTRQTVPPLDEQTQLDNILSDLLNDQVFVSPKSGSNTLSKETRTFRTFETQKGPDGKLSHQTAEVTYKLPGEVKEERSYTMKTEKEMKSYAPTHAFSYTPTSPELARRVESPKTTTLPYRTDYDNRFHSESSYNYNTMDNSRSMSDSDSSWLLQQQRKLREKKDVKDEKRVEQEKKLVEELRTAQNRYMTKRAKSEEEERDVMDSYHMNGLSAPPTGGYNYSMSRTHTYSKDSKSPNSSGDTSFDSKPVRPPPSPTQTRITIHSNTSTSAPISPPIRSSSKDYMSRSRTQSGGQTMQGSHTFTRQHSDVSYDRKNQIAPPVIRQITITTPPTTPRPFSPSYQTSTYIYSNKKTDSQPSPKVERKTQYQEMKPQEVTSSQSSWKQSSSQSYSTGSLPRHEPTKSKVTEIHESDIPLGQKKSHYITEVYVHRGPQTDSTTGTLEQNRTQKTEKVEHDTNRLTELERSLQAASNSIIASQPSQSWQQQKSTNQGFTQEHVVTRRVETRKYETHQQQQQQPQVIQPPISPPKQLRTVEEDRFSLRPIGPGVTPLEPEGGVGTGTLNRATTPSFPVSPVASAEQLIQSVHEKVRRMSLGSMRDLSATPPFPVTPKTPYVNQASTPTLSPTGKPPLATGSTFLPMAASSVKEQYSPAASTSTLGRHSPDFSLESIEAYNERVSRQISGHSDPVYASIPENLGSIRAEGTCHGYQASSLGNLHTAGGTTRVVDVQRSPSQPQQFSNTQQHQQQYRYEYQNQYNTNQQQNQFNPQQQQQFNQQQNQINNQQNQQFNQHQMTQQFNQQPLQFNQQHEYTKQQRTYTQQQYNQQQEGGGTLHVDTSPKMLSPGTASSTMTRSPSSPHSPDTLNSLRQQLNVAHTMSTGAVSPVSHSVTGQSSPSVYFGLSRRGSISSLAESVDATHTTPRFVKDTSKYWYKPHISREEAIQLLKDKSPGTFIVRDSNSFPGAFGLALKVATIPPNVQTKSSGDPAADLVRHFLIEPTPKGVRLRGCSNEPVFGSLASLVYQHSITPLALPCKLALPEIDTTTESSTMDSSMTSEIPSSAAALLAQGAACNVFYLNSVDTESLTGPQAVSKAIKQTLDQAQNVKQTVVHFKVSNQGITLTDNQRKLFFRRHYPVSAVTFCGMDPEGRKWLRSTDVPGVNVEARIFGFVARKQGGVSDNACHLFAELDPEQPASAIVNFVTKIMIGQGKVKP